MKQRLYILLISLLGLMSCNKDVLDKVPLDIISDQNVWTDQVLADAYLTQVYANMDVFCNDSPGENSTTSLYREYRAGFSYVNQASDEATRNWRTHLITYKFGNLNINGGFLEWWENGYKYIRALNLFIEKIQNAPVNKDFIKQRLAEARFLRAFNYFSMVKRYGGVPLITVAQALDAPEDSLYHKRDSEQKIYNFVISEMDAIANDLPEKNTSINLGRPCKYAALALKCRAALYAGSIAQYGTIQLDGLLGIEVSKANAYYQQAYDAAKLIMNSSNYALYNADADKSKNFRNIFLVKNHSEVILPRIHNNIDKLYGGGNGWNYDFTQCPKPHGFNAGNQNAPYLEMVEEFEHIDGTPGTLDRVSIQQGLWSIGSLFANKDPRFYATIYTQNTPWQGSKVDFHNGLILPDASILTSGSYNGTPALGTQSVDGSFGTGFGVMKYLDETHNNNSSDCNSSQDYLVFRYAEILLNYAEAAYELGKTGDALDAVNQIRNRSGMPSLEIVDRDIIRHERKVELAFEGHRYWDVRRWRIATTICSKQGTGLKYILDYTTGDYKIVLIENYDGVVSPPKFYEKNYYFPITLARTGNNPNLVENPGY